MKKYLNRGRVDTRNTYRFIIRGGLLICLLVVFGFIAYSVNSGHISGQKVADTNDIENRLYTPTYFTKIGNEYFIVDCWHNRVIYSVDPSQPIEKWRRLDTNLAGPHSVAKIGKYVVTEDTGRSSIYFYEKVDGEKYERTYGIHNLGYRPHRLVNDSGGRLFLLSSGSQDLYEININQNGNPEIIFTQNLNFLDNTYTRSFTFFKNKVLFVRADGYIVSASWDNDKLVENEKIKVPEDFSDLNDIYIYKNKIVITAGSAIGISDNLASLNNIKNQIQGLGIEGRPYFISELDNSLYIPEIANRSRIRSYKVEGTILIANRTLFDFIGATEPSKIESARLPK